MYFFYAADLDAAFIISMLMFFFSGIDISAVLIRCVFRRLPCRPVIFLGLMRAAPMT